MASSSPNNGVHLISFGEHISLDVFWKSSLNFSGLNLPRTTSTLCSRSSMVPRLRKNLRRTEHRRRAPHPFVSGLQRWYQATPAAGGSPQDCEMDRTPVRLNHVGSDYRTVMDQPLPDDGRSWRQRGPGPSLGDPSDPGMRICRCRS